MHYYCLVLIENPGVGGDIDPGSVVKVDTDDWLYFVKNIELPAHLFSTQNIFVKNNLYLVHKLYVCLLKTTFKGTCHNFIFQILTFFLHTC